MWIINLLRSLFTGWLSFRSATAESLGKAEEQASIEAQEIKIIQAEAKAVTNAPNDKESLISALKKGAVSLLFTSLVFLASCTINSPGPCPAIRQFTPAEEDQMAENFSVLPPESPLIKVGVEWSQLRAWAKTCWERNDG